MLHIKGIVAFCANTVNNGNIISKWETKQKNTDLNEHYDLIYWNVLAKLTVHSITIRM